jgi:3-methyladenine DNA glycosylase/8-oxoguanine DNA glycosylase
MRDAAASSASIECATDLAGSIVVLRRGPGDPTYRLEADGSIWRAALTPDGAGTIRISRSGPRVDFECWGPGAAWLAGSGAALVGAHDDPSGFGELVAGHPLLHDAHRRHVGLRMVRTGLMLQSLIPAILEQKVTTIEAFGSWSRLVRRFGEPAPGPAPEGLRVPPTPRIWALIPSWEWLRAGVDAKRSATIIRAVRSAAALERCAALTVDQAATRLRSIPGIGRWTAAETLQRTHGAADELSVGDLHLCKQVGYALAGERDADDARMLELLEPFRPHRHRTARLLLLAGPRMPRHAAHRTLPTHLPRPRYERNGGSPSQWRPESMGTGQGG